MALCPDSTVWIMMSSVWPVQQRHQTSSDYQRTSKLWRSILRHKAMNKWWTVADVLWSRERQEPAYVWANTLTLCRFQDENNNCYKFWDIDSMVRHAKCFFASALGLFVRATKRKCCSLDSRDKSGLLCWVEAWYHWNWYKSLSPYLGLRRVTSTGRENLIKVWSCNEDELSLRLTMSWSKRASGTKIRPDVLKPGL